MNLQYNHCVPTWNDNNFEDVAQVPKPPSMPPPPPSQPPQSLSRSFTTQSHSTSLSTGPNTSMLDYEMAELTWENGQLTMHGLGIPRVPSISNIADAVGWHEKTISRANDTLESVFNQAYYHRSYKSPIKLKGACEQNDNDDRVPLFDPTTPIHHVPVVSDALVPSNSHKVGCSTQEGSCSTAARVPLGSDWSMSMSVSESLRRKTQANKDTCEQILSMDTTNNKGFTSTSFGVSPVVNTKTFTIDDNDSTSQSTPKRARDDEEDENQKQDRTKSTISTKRSRAAAVHNQSERKRRDKINQRMKTLQKLVPNSNKVDKASILDEVIEYLKQLQAQVQMLSRMSLPLPSMMMPLAIQHQLQMPMNMNMNMNMMSPLNMGMNMRMGIDQMNMGMNSMIGRPNINAIQPPPMNMAPYNIPLATCDGSTTSIGVGDCLLPQGPLPSTEPLLTYLTCGQSLPMAMDAYNRMAAMYQQLQQQTLQQQRQNHQQHEHAPGNYNI